MTEDARSTHLHTPETRGQSLQQGSLDVRPRGYTHDQSRDTSENLTLSDKGWTAAHLLNGDWKNMKNEIGILQQNIATMPTLSRTSSKDLLKWRIYWAAGSIFVMVIVCLSAILYFKHLYDNERINLVHAKLQCKAKEDKIDVLESLRIKYESDLLVRDKELKTLREEMLTSERHTRERLAEKEKVVDDQKRSCETQKDQLRRTVDQMRANQIEFEKRIHQFELAAKKQPVQSARTGGQSGHKAAKGITCPLLLLMAPVIYTIMAGLD